MREEINICIQFEWYDGLERCHRTKTAAPKKTSLFHIRLATHKDETNTCIHENPIYTKVPFSQFARNADDGVVNIQMPSIKVYRQWLY